MVWESVVYGGKDLLKSQVLSLEWNTERVREDASGDSEDVEDDELPCVIAESAGDCVGRGSRRSVESSFHRQGAAYLKERLVIFKEERVGGRARVTIDEERVLWQGWTEIKSCYHLGNCEFQSLTTNHSCRPIILVRVTLSRWRLESRLFLVIHITLISQCHRQWYCSIEHIIIWHLMYPSLFISSRDHLVLTWS